MIRLWELPRTPNPLQPLTTIPAPHGAINQLTFINNDRTLAAACDDGTVRFWDVAGWTPGKFVARHPKPVWCLALSLDGAHLATACKDQVTLWDLAKEKELLRQSARTEPIHCLSFAHTGAVRVAVGSTFLWPYPPAGKKVFDQSGAAAATAFAPRGKVLAVVDDAERTVWLCDPDTGQPRFAAERARGYGFFLSRTAAAYRSDLLSVPGRHSYVPVSRAA